MTRKRAVEVAAALAAVALVTGCGGAGTAGRRQAGGITNGVFKPAQPGAAQYGADPAATCPTSNIFKHLQEQLILFAREQGKQPPQPDGRLCEVAQTLAGWSESDTPPESVTSIVSWHHGLPAPAARVAVVTFETDDSRVVAGRLLEPIQRFAADAAAPRYGVVTERVRRSPSASSSSPSSGDSTAGAVRAVRAANTKAVIVLYDAAAELEQPVTRQLPAGGQARLAGHLAPGLTKATVLVTDPAGKLDQPTQTGSAFQADLRCGEKLGLLLVEVRGEKNGGQVSAARFPIACGVEAPSTAPVGPLKAGPIDEVQAARKVFEDINADRATVGAPPVQWDDAVAKVAKSAADATRDESKAGGAGAVDFDVVAQLKKADVVSALVLMNPAAARSAEEAQWRMAHSPVHRANMLNPQATHGAVAVSTYQDPAVGAVYFVNELLVRQLQPVDTDKARAQLRAAVARKRSDARAGPLASDPMLEEVAQKYATALAAARGDLPKAQADAILAPLYKSFRTVGLVGGAKGDAVEFAEESGVVAPAKVLGVGVAGGSNAVLGKNTPYVIILVGTRR